MGLENLYEPIEQNALAATSGLFDNIEARDLNPLDLAPGISPGIAARAPYGAPGVQPGDAARQPVTRSGLSQFLLQGLPSALAAAFSNDPGGSALSILQQRAQVAMQREDADRKERLQQQEFALRAELQKESFRLQGEQQGRTQDRLDNREAFRTALTLAKAGMPFGESMEAVSTYMQGGKLTPEKQAKLSKALSNPLTEVKATDMIRFRKDVMTTALRETLAQFGTIEDAVRNAQAADQAFMSAVQSSTFKGGNAATMNLRRLSEAANVGRPGAEGLAGSATVAPKSEVTPAELQETVNGAIQTLDPRLQKAFARGGGLYSMMERAQSGQLSPQEIGSTVQFLQERGFEQDDILVVQDLLNVSFGTRDGKILINTEAEEDLKALQKEEEGSLGFENLFRGGAEALRSLMDPNVTTFDQFFGRIQQAAFGPEQRGERVETESEPFLPAAQLQEQQEREDAQTQERTRRVEAVGTERERIALKRALSNVESARDRLKKAGDSEGVAEAEVEINKLQQDLQALDREEGGAAPSDFEGGDFEGGNEEDYLKYDAERQKALRSSGQWEKGSPAILPNLKAAIEREAAKQGVDPLLALAVVGRETRGGRDLTAFTPFKNTARGPFQITADTATDERLRISKEERLKLPKNIEGGVRLLKVLERMFNDPELAAAAYFAGEGRVRQLLRQGGKEAVLNHRPPDSEGKDQGSIRDFVQDIRRIRRELKDPDLTLGRLEELINE